MNTQLPKGTFDILPYGAQELWRLSDLWQYVENLLREISAEYGYREIRTPAYEHTELFIRGVGETTDVVMKEMFTFEDRGQRSLSLRPEGTASVARAIVEHSLMQTGPTHKFFYIGPMFRYERPQSGRYRQHHQFGIEAYGNSSAEQDAEVIDLLMQIYKRLGLKNCKAHVNSLGDTASRDAYRQALVAYFTPYAQELSPDSQIRLTKNPLRILDSKDPKDREIIARAPSILAHLSPESKQHFHRLCHLLDQIQVPYVVDDKIVRGLDYYNKTVFEVLTDNQTTLGGGGRYDGLLAKFGGPDTPSVGFATGLERVLQTMQAAGVPFAKSQRPLIYFIPMDEKAKEKAFTLTSLCRHHKIAAEIELTAKKVGAAIQNAVRLEAKFCCVIGSSELETGRAQLKELETRDVKDVKLDQIVETLKNLL